MKKPLTFVMTISLFIIFTACKKEDLSGYLKEDLIGEWKWVRTDNHLSSGVISYTEQHHEEVVFEFLEKGILKIKIRGKCEHRYRIKDVDISQLNTENIGYDMDVKPIWEDGNIHVGITNYNGIDSLVTVENTELFDFTIPNPQLVRSTFARIN